MAKIHLLDNDVINKIAAGEVVERPASVLKELIDNSIDAGATRIEIDCEGGGIQKMMVRDNGSGMGKEDLAKSLVRHATSKIKTSGDLFSVMSMGFRGEALASIASVSEFSIASNDGSGGTRLKANFTNDGELDLLESEWHGDQGTMVTVENLFDRIPARKNFLKSSATEHGHCSDVIYNAAVANPHLSFIYRHNGKEIYRLEGVPRESNEKAGETTLRHRALEIFGEKTAAQLIYVSFQDAHGNVEGVVSPPGFEKATAKSVYMVVNGRAVKDKTIRFGIMRGYHSHILKGKYPVGLVHFNCDPSLVDVNVHPAKTELRFQYASEVQTIIVRAIREGIRQGAWAKADWNTGPIPSERETLVPSFPMPTRSPASTVQYFDTGSGRGCQSSSGSSPQASRNAGPVTSRANPMSWSSSFEEPESPMTTSPVTDPVTSRAPVDEGAAIPWEDLEFVGTYGQCYLLFEVPGAGKPRLLVIDQHAFHERILFERLTKNPDLLNTRQKLLIPELCELDAVQVAALKDMMPDLGSRGFDMEIMGETSVEVRAVPQILGDKNITDLLHDLVEPESAEEDTTCNAGMARLILATVACHSAVRAGELLSEDDRKVLLAEASDVDFYLNCPHGRRVFKWFGYEQVGRWFDR